MNTGKLVGILTGVLLFVYILVVMLPMIQTEITDATASGGALETVDGVALLIALPAILLIVAVVGVIKGFSSNATD
jgi:hypothetical protein